jgi:hypothetical protein
MDIQRCFKTFRKARSQLREFDEPPIALRGYYPESHREFFPPRLFIPSPRRCRRETPGELRNRQALQSDIFDQAARLQTFPIV